MKTKLYWIRYDTHSDPFTEGYIGITANVEKRLNYHTKGYGNDNPRLRSAIAKGATLEILEEFNNREDALKSEEHYRNSENIGWNIIKGGTQPPSVKGKKFTSPIHGMRGKTHSQATKQLMSEKRKNKLWFNNGVKAIRSYECPDGFIPGCLHHKTGYTISDEKRKNMGRPGIKISTPHGIFNSILEAVRELNLSEDQIRWRLKKEKYIGWKIIES